LSESANLANPAYTSAMDHMTQAGLSQAQATGVMAHNMIGQSYLLSSIDIFAFAGVGCVVMLGLLWCTRKPAPQQGAPVMVD